MRQSACVIALLIIAALPGCGVGGRADGVPSTTSPATNVPTPAPLSPNGSGAATAAVADNSKALPLASDTPALPGTLPASTTSCAVKNNQDVLGGLAFQNAHRINAPGHACTIVLADKGHPVHSGSESARFEVRPGDCSASASFDDCINDRSRSEINETTVEPTHGKTLLYTTHLFIPAVKRLKPLGKNTLFLTQINFVDDFGLYGTLAYLEVGEDGGLLVRTDKGFTYDIHAKYPVLANPYDKWIKLAWEIRSSVGPDGFIKVYVNDVLKVHESRPTLPHLTATNRLKFGIYNVFMVRALKPYFTQVVYFDSVSKIVR